MAYKAYEATYTKNGSGPETMLVGANSLSAAAKKAEEYAEQNKGTELVKMELTDRVIL